MGEPVEFKSEEEQQAAKAFNAQQKEQKSLSEASDDDIDTVITAKGSSYKYLPDGSTQRFKEVEGKYQDPQSALVFIPDYEWVRENAPKQVLDILGENELIYHQTLQEYIHTRGKKVHIVDEKGAVLETNRQIRGSESPVYLSFGDKNKVDFSIPVSAKPQIGFSTYDTRKYIDESTGETIREKHIGHKAVKIIKKKQGSES